MTLGFDALMKVYEAAKECKEDGKMRIPVAMMWWNQCSISPSTSLKLRAGEWNLCKLLIFRVIEHASADDRLRQTQTINPHHMPRSISNTNDIKSKKVDYAILLNHRSENRTVSDLYGALREHISEDCRGLWTNSFTKTLIPFSLFEVNSANVKEAEVQMMTASYALLNSLEKLLNTVAPVLGMEEAKKESLLARLPPVIGWIVLKHEWKFCVCHRIDPKDRTDRRHTASSST